MTKYVLTNGDSVVKNISEDVLEITTEVKDAIKFDNAGAAMQYAIKVNELLNFPLYNIFAIDTSVSSNL